MNEIFRKMFPEDQHKSTSASGAYLVVLLLSCVFTSFRLIFYYYMGTEEFWGIDFPMLFHFHEYFWLNVGMLVIVEVGAVFLGRKYDTAKSFSRWFLIFILFTLFWSSSYPIQ